MASSRSNAMLLFVVCGVVCAFPGSSEARPLYHKYFKKLYRFEKGVSCKVCHPAKSKKKLNCYGQALKDVLKEGRGPKATRKSKKEVMDGMRKIESYRCVKKVKTFGDLIKSGYAPCSNSPKCGEPVTTYGLKLLPDPLPDPPPLPTSK